MNGAGNNRFGFRQLALQAAAVAFLAAPVCSLETLCAVVKLEILQEAALEREAFVARLALTNNSADKLLTGLKVNILITGATDYKDANQLFFIKINSLAEVNDVNGNGVIQPKSKAVIDWLIIPSQGAAGNSPLGKEYSVRAEIFFELDGAPEYIPTYDDTITIRPQPNLRLTYLLPFSVFGDEALTEDVVEPVEPFPLALRVTNSGYGTARSFAVNSGKPEIAENSRGLLVDFNITGAYVNGREAENSLLVNLGDIPANGVAQAQWTMTASLSGRFLSMDADFTHAAELGGAVTSLIESVTAHTLLKEVLVDLPGRDNVYDLLVNTTTPRADIYDMLVSTTEPAPDVILESDHPAPIPVRNVNGRLEGSLSGTNSTLTLEIDEPIAAPEWIHFSTPVFGIGEISLQSVLRPDGTALSSRNFWISKFFNKEKKPWGPLSLTYWAHVLDYNTTGSGIYRLVFDAAKTDSPPNPVTDMSVQQGAGSAKLMLSWTSAGEDLASGSILGGKYAVEYSSSEAYTGFSTASAQIIFSTNTAPNTAQKYFLGGLRANTTYYLRLWTRDTGGNWSALSNAATGYAAKAPASPVLSLVPDVSTSVVQGSALTVRAAAYDANLYEEGVTETLAFSTQTLIAGATFTVYPASATFAWTPAAGQTGVYPTTFTVTDADGLSDSRLLIITALPATPAGFSGAALGISSIAWAWEASSPDADGFRIYSSTGDSLVSQLLSGNTSFMETELTPNALYLRYIRSYNAYGESPKSAPAAVVTLAEPVTIPTLVSVGFQHATLAWTLPPSPAAGFRLEVSTDPVFVSGVIFSSATGNPNLSVLAVFGLQPETVYYLRVAALNLVGVPNFSAAGSTTTSAEVLPGMPFFVTVDSTTLSASWPANGNPEGTAYLAQISTDSFVTLSASSRTVNTWVSFAGLTPNTTYDLRVQVVNAFFTAPVSTLTTAAQPAAAFLAAATTASLLASWSPAGNPPDTVYRVEISSSGFPAPVISTTAVSLTFGNLQANTVYNARVVAMDRAGRLTAGLTLGTRSTLALPPEPSSGPALAQLFETSATLAWTPRPASPAEESCFGYRLDACVDAAYRIVFASASVAETAASSLTIRGLVPGVTFYFRVGSLNADGAASWLALASTASYSATYAGAVVDAAVETVMTITEARVEIPPAAFPDGTVVSLNAAPEDVPPPNSMTDKFTAVGGGLEIKAGGLQPGAPLLIRIRFDRRNFPARGPNVTLGIGRYDTADSRWQLLPTTVNEALREAVAETDHLSLFNLFLLGGFATLDEMKIFPVPWKPGSGDQRFDAGALAFRQLTFPARVSIYTIMGEKIWSGKTDFTGSLDWPGTNDAGRRAASGVYLAVIEGGLQKVVRRVVLIR